METKAGNTCLLVDAHQTTLVVVAGLGIATTVGNQATGRRIALSALPRNAGSLATEIHHHGESKPLSWTEVFMRIKEITHTCRSAHNHARRSATSRTTT